MNVAPAPEHRTKCVPFLDLKSMHAPLMDQIDQRIRETIESHAFACGPAVEQFEAQFAEYCGVKHCVCVSSGTSALHLALICAGVSPGDEVITSPATWISTSWAITYVGATPVFADIEPQSYCLDPNRVEDAITARTTAILPVHLYGHPANMDAIRDIACRHNVVVIEDAAQAHGASYQGSLCGALGDIAAFSFYPGKNLGAFGEGGAITTNCEYWAMRARCLRDHAQIERHRHLELGFNYRMDSIQAAVLSVKLSRLDQWNASRHQVARAYEQGLADLPRIEVPTEAPGASSAWHLYSLQAHDRDELRKYLSGRGIQTGLHYPTPVHLQPAYAHLKHVPGDFPVAEQLASHQISLPMFPDLLPGQIQHVIDSIRVFWSA